MKFCRILARYTDYGDKSPKLAGKFSDEAPRAVRLRNTPGFRRREKSTCSILLFMQLTLIHIGAAARNDAYEAPTHAYLERCSKFASCASLAFRTEAALLEWLERQRRRTPALAVFLDSRGKQMASEAFAAWLGARRDEGTQHIVFAVGPADGWSEEARAQARFLLSLGPMTLAHSLARLVMAEQIYRAFAILTGHPYHGGH